MLLLLAACQFEAPGPVGQAPIPDAGFLVMVGDGGTLPGPDAGGPEDAQAGSEDAQAPDAGSVTDAGVVFDSGALVDAGMTTPDSGTSPDAGIPALTCAALQGAALGFSGAQPMGGVRALAPAGTAGMRPALLSDDGSQFYAALLQPDGQGGGADHFELWVYSRASDADPFALSPLETNLDVGTFNTSDEVSLSYVSADDRYWFSQIETTSSRVRSAELRTSPEDFFPSWVDEWSGFPDGSAPQYSGAALSADGRTIVTTVDAQGQRDLREYARQTVLDPWTPTNRIDALNEGAFDDLDPYLSPDGLILIFASTRQGGQLDLFYSCRNSPGDTWPPASGIAGINTPNMDERAPVGRLVGTTLTLLFSRASTSGPWVEDVFEAVP